MAELTLSASDIASALKKNLEGFEPSLEARTVGRITEVFEAPGQRYAEIGKTGRTELLIAGRKPHGTPRQVDCLTERRPVDVNDQAPREAEIPRAGHRVLTMNDQLADLSRNHVRSHWVQLDEHLKRLLTLVSRPT